MVDLLPAQEEDGADSGDLDAAVARAIEDVAEKQLEAGVNVIYDGEQARPDYTTHVKDRLTGIRGANRFVVELANDDNLHGMAMISGEVVV